MNDFNKEELEDLEALVQQVCCGSITSEDLEDYWFPLKHKLQFMIANYYENEKDLKDGQLIELRNRLHNELLDLNLEVWKRKLE